MKKDDDDDDNNNNRLKYILIRAAHFSDLFFEMKQFYRTR